MEAKKMFADIQRNSVELKKNKETWNSETQLYVKITQKTLQG